MSKMNKVFYIIIFCLILGCRNNDVIPKHNTAHDPNQWINIGSHVTTRQYTNSSGHTFQVFFTHNGGVEAVQIQEIKNHD